MRVFRIAEDVPGTRLVLVAADRRCWQFDRARGVIVGGGSWLDERVSVPATSIDHLRLTITAPLGNDLTLTLTLRHRAADTTPVEVAETLRVAGLDRAAEALDLAFRIAQIIDFGGYHVRRERDERTTIELIRHGPAESSPYRAAWAGVRDVAGLSTTGEPQPTAALTALADYTTGSRFLEPPFAVAPVAAGDSLAEVQVVAWNADVIELDARRVTSPWRLLVDALSDSFAMLWYLAILIAVPCVAWLLLRWTWNGLFGDHPEAAFYSWKDYLAFAVWMLFLLILWLGAIAAPFGMVGIVAQFVRHLHAAARHRGQPRHARFDLTAGRLTLQVGPGTREVPIADIEAIVHHTHDFGIWHWSELELQLPGADELLLVTETTITGGRPAVFRLTIALARALDLPWRVSGLDPTDDDPVKALRS